MAGGVRRNGKPLRRPGLPVESGWRLELEVDAARLAPRGDLAPELTERDVVFMDEFLLALAKPPGLPCVPTADPARPSLVRAAEGMLRARGQPDCLAVHQRLDRDTSGVVLFARHPRANAGLSAAFAERRVEKVYLVLTGRPSRPLPDHFEADAPVHGKAALTEFRVRARHPGGLLLEARPRTGRKHQIRIHLAQAGASVLGDARYGRAATAARTMLHAWRLVLTHPVSGERLRLECAVPRDFRTAAAALARPARPSRRARRGRPRAGGGR